MKLFYPLPLLLLFLVTTMVNSQNVKNLPPVGGGDFIQEHTECITADERLRINRLLADNIRYLQSIGLIAAVPLNDSLSVQFDWPLRKTLQLEYNNYYTTNNFVDHAGTEKYLDYNCGTRTVNGHNGTDMATWPFPWYIFDNNFVEVIAATGGIIIGKIDLNEDNHCACYGATNGVFIRHTDGSIAWYTSLKRGSLTRKNVGQFVVKGEYLGLVGSAGCSRQPHLHFEVYDNKNNLVDPYRGPCNTLNKGSLWSKQEDYRTPTVNAALTHDDIPVFGCRSDIENPKLRNVFYPESKLYTAAYFRDQLKDMTATYRIVRPDGSVWQTWGQKASNDYDASWWYWIWTIPVNGPFGTWHFEADFNGQTVIHEFQVLSPLPVALVNFTARSVNDNSVDLNWQVASEHNNDYFAIENSQDNLDFKQVGKVKGKGTTPQFQSYNYRDLNPFPGINYYRLRQVDLDGTEKLSAAVAVLIQKNGISLFPNPASQTVEVRGLGSLVAHCQIIDPMGRIVQEQPLPDDRRIDLASLPKGFYWLQVIAGKQHFSQKLVIVDP